MKTQIWNYSLIIIGALLILNACKKKEEEKPAPQLAVLSTTALNNIFYNSASGGGTISSDGGATVTSSGISYSTSPNPTIANTFTSDGSATGGFTSKLTGLAINTTYYVRAYATNTVGTAYGNEVNFTTSATIFTPGTGGTDIDGNTYTSIILGTQEWMVENLQTTSYANGDPIPNITDPTAWSTLTNGAWSYHSNDVLNNVPHGKLYNWFAVEDSRNISPTGWHVPSDAEWTVLINYLGGASVAGGKMKETGLAYWASPNTAGDNSSGFTALAGGYRTNFGSSTSMTFNNYLWSSTAFDGTYVWGRYLGANYSNAYSSYYRKENGFSVRCVRD